MPMKELGRFNMGPDLVGIPELNMHDVIIISQFGSIDRNGNVGGFCRFRKIDGFFGDFKIIVVPVTKGCNHIFSGGSCSSCKKVTGGQHTIHMLTQEPESHRMQTKRQSSCIDGGNEVECRNTTRVYRMLVCIVLVKPVFVSRDDCIAAIGFCFVKETSGRGTSGQAAFEADIEEVHPA